MNKNFRWNGRNVSCPGKRNERARVGPLQHKLRTFVLFGLLFVWTARVRRARARQRPVRESIAYLMTHESGGYSEGAKSCPRCWNGSHRARQRDAQIPREPPRQIITKGKITVFLWGSKALRQFRPGSSSSSKELRVSFGGTLDVCQPDAPPQMLTLCCFCPQSSFVLFGSSSFKIHQVSSPIFTLLFCQTIKPFCFSVLVKSDEQKKKNEKIDTKSFIVYLMQCFLF